MSIGWLFLYYSSAMRHGRVINQMNHLHTQGQRTRCPMNFGQGNVRHPKKNFVTLQQLFHIDRPDFILFYRLYLSLEH
jgi:hypothetical protein